MVPSSLLRVLSQLKKPHKYGQKNEKDYASALFRGLLYKKRGLLCVPPSI